MRELILLDPRGGSDKLIKRYAREANKAAGRTLARYERGYPELFPLAPQFHHEFPVCGRLPNGRAAVAAPDCGLHLDGDTILTGMIVITFDATGAQTNEVLRVPLSPELANIKLRDISARARKYTDHLTQAIGFVPAFIRVKGFGIPGYGSGPNRDWSGRCLGLADDPENPTNMNDDPDPHGVGGFIYKDVRNVEFMIGHSAFANKRGRVHST
ncbi:MAG: hypothetical protein FJ304_01550 [Planctomycetes bacterium]|nr:hypothetical protein [Planctomycetota bacterium]